MQKIIELKNTSRQYDSGPDRVQALDKINLDINKGEFVVIIGKSGSGKSTLLNMFAGIDRASTGEVIIDGVDLGRLNESELDRWRGAKVGVVFQFFQLMPNLTALENIQLPMDFSKRLTPRQRTNKAIELLEQVGLGDRKEHFPSQLSGGEQQRTAIARALANDPLLLLADEPTGNLDSLNRSKVYKLFKQLNSSGLTVVVVSHDMDVSNYASRSLELLDGSLVEDRRTTGNDNPEIDNV